VLAGIHRIPVCVLRLAPERFQLIAPRTFARSIAELL
jgi:sarcosine oxidase gamma subunit